MLGYYLASRIFSPAKHIDALVLSPPTSAPDQPLPLARELFHRHAAYLLARRYQRAEWLLTGAATIALVPVAAIHGPGTGASLYAIPLAIGGAILAATHGGQALTRWLCRNSQRWTDQATSLHLVQRTMLRDVPRGAPDDLADPWRHGWISDDGRPLSADICEVDLRATVLQTRGSMWMLTSATVGLVIFGALASPIMALAGITGLGVARLILDPDLARQRARLLDLSAAKTAEGAAWAYGGATVGANRPDAARRTQLEISMRDKSPILTLAECLGLLSARGNPLSPSAGRPMQISIDDLMQHLIVFGGVGSGKTSGILRPLLLQLGKLPRTGIIVMDAKGALPYEVQDAIPGMVLIEPSLCEVSLVAGLTPTEIVSTIVDILAPSGGSDGGSQNAFFTSAAANLLRLAAIIAQRLGGPYWTLAGIYAIASTGAVGVLDQVDPPEDSTNETPAMPDDPELTEAVTYFRSEWPALDPKTSSSVIATARNWYSTITAHPDGLRWAETGDDEPDAVDVLSVLTGGRVGILAPAYKYGAAGPALVGLLKARISAGIRDRAGRPRRKDETPVVMVIDEVQDVATNADADLLAIARSLDLAVVAATQTVEGVESKLGKAAPKWLNIYGSVIALANRSRETDKLISERVGSAYGAHIDTFAGVPDVRSSIVAQNGSGSLAGGRHQQSVRDALAGNDSGIVRQIVDKLNPFRIIGNAISDAKDGSADKGPTSKVGTRAWVAEEEVQALVCEPDTALACINRARVPRSDLVRLHPVYPTQRPSQAGQAEMDEASKTELEEV
jgi:hypothetical protein